MPSFSWFHILVVAAFMWKPTYFLIMSFVKYDSSYLTQLWTYFKELYTLVTPIGVSW